MGGGLILSALFQIAKIFRALSKLKIKAVKRELKITCFPETSLLGFRFERTSGSN